MKKIFLLSLLFISAITANAQLFIDKGMVEYEVKTNIQKTIGEGRWAEIMKEKLPGFKVAYYHLSFSGEKTLYRFDHFDEASNRLPDYMKKDDEENEWYNDFSTGLTSVKKMVVGTPFYIRDSIRKIDWKLSNENRTIAGFNCRKATGKIFDSVYVFVFYTEELPVSAGPCGISGLPGTILGMTIPRLYTSWIATKVNAQGLDESKIKPGGPAKGMKIAEFSKAISERTKDWGGADADGKKWLEQFLWNSLL